ncbi:recombinase family protein [Shinella sp. JR1-6]|uniref:recombinase family protein n=1 Tax=Shinella sp. JR1-6 TaxID=2527671 RepID=UPI002110AA60|nr:recombinase family protein [Shinella sp. JR1-6]
MTQKSRLLLFPSRLHDSQTVFRPLTPSTAMRVLHNPRYAGTYAYGRRRYRRTIDGKKLVRKQDHDDWTACIPDAHPGYISCWVGRLPTASRCARMSSLKSQSRETVRGADYPNWYRYVKECIPTAWRERSRATSPAQEALAQGNDEVLREGSADHHRA